MAKKKSAAKVDSQATFEESLQKLQNSLAKLEEGNLGLDETLAEYEAGVTHLRRCYGKLEAAERKVEQLVSVDEEGNARTEPFAEE